MLKKIPGAVAELINAAKERDDSGEKTNKTKFRALKDNYMNVILPLLFAMMCGYVVGYPAALGVTCAYFLWFKKVKGSRYERVIMGLAGDLLPHEAGYDLMYYILNKPSKTFLRKAKMLPTIICTNKIVPCRSCAGNSLVKVNSRNKDERSAQLANFLEDVSCNYVTRNEGVSAQKNNCCCKNAGVLLVHKYGSDLGHIKPKIK